MRRMIVLLLAAGLLVGIAGCGGAPSAKVPTLAPIPTKTARPTFTNTPVLPTATRLVPTPTAIPSATMALATNTPEATPTSAETRAMLKANDVANVRSGPGTAYPKIGQLQAGQELEVTGKNADGDWWQFSLDGKPGWVAASMVTANDQASSVQVAEAPAAPAAPVVAQPQPQAQPQTQPPPQPTQPPKPSFPYGAAGAETREKTNDPVTIRCRVFNDSAGTNLASGYLRVSGPAGTVEQRFNNVVDLANPGPNHSREYKFNQNCKVEQYYAPGAFTAQVLDDNKNPMGDPIQFTPSENQREVIVTWIRH